MKYKIKKKHGLGKITGGKLEAAALSLAANLFLIIIKFAAAVQTGSLGIIAEMLHSVFDLVASVFAYLGIQKSQVPPDEDHHYGHDKYENLASLAQTILIFITGIIIILEAASRLQNPISINSSFIGIAVILVAIAVDFLLSDKLRKASEYYGSAALKADALHFTTDLWGAIAVVAGLLLSSMGYPIFDSLAAIAVALMMLWTSVKLGAESLDVLLDRCPSELMMEKIKRIITSTKGVRNFHKLKARQAGNSIFADVHVRVDRGISVEKGHEISHRVKANLMKRIKGLKEITIHIEPFEPAE